MDLKKVAVLAVQSATGEVGGAERFYKGLTDALKQAGVVAELVSEVSDESCFEAILESYLRFYDLDLSDYDGVISTKAPAYLIRHPNHVCYLQHTMRVFYDMYEYEFGVPTPQLERQRRLIHQLDTGALQYPRTRKIFVIGHEVRRRLRVYNGLEAEVLYQALTFDRFRNETYEDYLFLPGRLHRWKRVDLAIEAMKRVDRPLKLKIAGTGEDEDKFRSLAGNDPRIEFLGRISDDELVELYARALAVVFVPIREDFGLVTLEAFKSGKPVITCSDSGEPAHIVQDGLSGFVCAPVAAELAERMELLFDHPHEAAMMGERGLNSIRPITWDNVAVKLLEALDLS